MKTIKAFSKKISRQDAEFAINSGSNHETSIKISDDICGLFLDTTSAVDKSKNPISFIIQRSDFIKSACYIISLLPLLDKGGDMVYYAEDLFDGLIKSVKDFFGDSEEKAYTAELFFNKTRLSYIQGFPNDFNIRNYFIESKTELKFSLCDDGKVYLNIKNINSSSGEIKDPINLHSQNAAVLPLQQIFYGAPGTGKSHGINEETKGKSVIRTTFHPDSDYSTFVGAYKPIMEECEARVVPVVFNNGISMDQNTGSYNEKRISYKFVKQAFLKAYLAAWKKYVEAADSVEPQFLIIEEINRGNCAQIFGDIFQLLDRADNNFSSYPIEADTDIQAEIQRAFAEEEEYKLSKNISADNVVENYTSNYGKTLSEDIQEGRVLLLPPNLYIWATMNTSDQSLFPIDSAFKRRWDWKYVPINTKKENWSIAADSKKYAWGNFLELINKEIYEATSSEDKKLGFYFCKAQDGVVSADRFVSKVLFYIYNDVFKDYGFDKDFFKDGNEVMTFQSFYNMDGTVNEAQVAKLLNQLGVDAAEVEEDEDGNPTDSPISKRDYTKYAIDEKGQYAKNNLATECVKKYIELNPTKSAEEVIKDWQSLGINVSHFIESKETFDARTDNSKRSSEIPCGDTVVYVAHNGYGSNGRAQQLMDAVNDKGWGFKVSIAKKA